MTRPYRNINRCGIPIEQALMPDECADVKRFLSILVSMADKHKVSNWDAISVLMMEFRRDQAGYVRDNYKNVRRKHWNGTECC